jgi:L-asparaginase
VHAFVLGGTISMTKGAGGVRPSLSSEKVFANITGMETTARVVLHDFRMLPGASLRLDDIGELAALITRELDGDAAGVVVVQGTDTIEDVAFCLDLMIQTPKPVVVTGAMRSPAAAGPDGDANLSGAIVTASSGIDFGGVVVVLGDEVHAAKLVSKAHSTKPAAFQSPAAGPLGTIIEGAVVALLRLRRRGPVVGMTAVRDSASVPLVVIGLDDDGLGLTVGHLADGLVIETMGAGHVPSWLVDPIAEMSARIPVVMASRTRSGPTLTATYGFPGSEQDLLRAGVIPAGSLTSIKARLLLLLLLRAGADRATIIQTFAELD